MESKKRIAQWAAALEPDTRVFAGSYLLLLPFFLWPLVVTRLLPGLDLPFHLSMVDMLSKAGRPDSPYDRFYQATSMWPPAPYALHYWALSILTVGHLVTLTAAHKIVIALYVAGLPLAAGSLLAACGRSRIPALLAFPLAYNLTLHYGFISSAISLPVVLLLLAKTTRLLTWQPEAGPAPPRVVARAWAATAAMAALLFLSHLQNFLYGVCAGLAFVVLCRAGWRRRLLTATAYLPALAALAWWQGHASFEGDTDTRRKTVGFVWSAVRGARLSDLGGRSLAADLADRLSLLPTHALRSFYDGVDIRTARTLLVLVALYFCLGLAGWVVDRPAEERRPRVTAACWVAFGGALFAYLALPHHLQVFELMTFFPRFAPLAVAMMLPLIPGGLKRASPEVRALLPLPAVLLGVLYGRELVRHYEQYGKEMADFLAVLDRAEPGHRATGLVFDRQSRVMHIESTLVGLPSYYVADHHARLSMTPLSYCGMRHIPCRHKPEFRDLPDPGAWEPGKLDPDRAVPFFDYFFVRSPPRGDLFGRRQWAMELLAHQGSWWLWRRRPDTAISPLDRPYED
jgi:hypothetical protein